jgi:N utilization substance protein B
VKVLQAVYAYHQSEVKDLRSAKSFLKKSIHGIEDTFINILQFPYDLFHFVKTNYNPADKHLKVENGSGSVFNYLSDNKSLDVLTSHPKSKDLFTAASYNWGKENDFLFLMYKQIGETDWIKQLENQDSSDFNKSHEFLTNLYKYLIETSDDFNIKMEEINIHWQDEKIPVLKSVERLLKSCTEDGSMIDVPLISKDLEDDLEYSEKLLEQTTKNHSKYEELISKRTPEWDSERIARIDLYIMVMALAEFMEFPSIPVKVTINEYLELAKIYSTPQSSKFINGILDKLLNELKIEGKVKKYGRGLVE